MSNPTKASRPIQHAYPNPHRFPWVRALLAAVISIGLFAGVAGAVIATNIGNQFKKSVLDTSHLVASGAQSDPATATPKATDNFQGRSVNLLITGIDSRYGENGTVGAGTSEEQSSILTDVNIVLHISADRQNAQMISIPRDMMVDIPDCYLEDGSTTYSSYQMFNAAFNAGGGLDSLAGGMACTQSTAELLTGLTIDGFVLVDFIGFERMIDAIGGVELYIDQDIDDSRSGATFTMGLQTLNGVQALQYSRVRYGMYNRYGALDGSDVFRVDRQQQLMGAMMKKVLDSNVLTNLPSLLDLTQEVVKNINVSSSLQSIGVDVGLINSLRNMPRDNFIFLTTPSTGDPSNPNRLVEVQPLADAVWAATGADAPLPPGTEYKNIDNVVFVVGEDGLAVAQSQ